MENYHVTDVGFPHQPEQAAVPQSTYDLLKDRYPDMLTLTQVAEITGTSAATWHSWQRQDKSPIPIVDLGGIKRVRLIDLCYYIDQQIYNHSQIEEETNVVAVVAQQ
jgi:hypothetical protein